MSALAGRLEARLWSLTGVVADLIVGLAATPLRIPSLHVEAARAGMPAPVRTARPLAAVVADLAERTANGLEDADLRLAAAARLLHKLLGRLEDVEARPDQPGRERADAVERTLEELRGRLSAVEARAAAAEDAARRAVAALEVATTIRRRRVEGGWAPPDPGRRRR